MVTIARREGKKIKNGLVGQIPGQAAMEYLTTYGWAILIIAVVLILLYVFVSSPYSVAPQKCIVSSGIYCNDIVFGSNAVASKVVFLLSNSQQYPLNSPSIIVNAQNSGNVTGSCSPDSSGPTGYAGYYYEYYYSAGDCYPPAGWEQIYTICNIIGGTYYWYGPQYYPGGYTDSDTNENCAGYNPSNGC